MNIQEAFDITAPHKPLSAAQRAQAELTRTADSLEHAKLAAMLRVCAEGLAANPDGVGMCDRNHDRLWYAMEHPEEYPDAPTATELHIAALAFWRAARLLKGTFE